MYLVGLGLGHRRRIADAQPQVPTGPVGGGLHDMTDRVQHILGQMQINRFALRRNEGQADGEQRKMWVGKRRTSLKLEPYIWVAMIEVCCRH